MFRLEFSTNNAAFEFDHREEMKRILSIIIRNLESDTSNAIFDFNGNKIGHWYFDMGEE